LPHPTAITYGVNAEQLANLTGVHITTARRWKRGEQPLPPPVAKLLSIVPTGELGGVDAAWRGWCLRGGELYAPDLAADFKPGDVLAIPFVRAQLREHQREQRFPRQADAFSERFAPVPVNAGP
jgi:hypothetical protein